MDSVPFRIAIGLLALCLQLQLQAADSFRVATYNVENFLDQPSGTRPAKGEAAKAKVCESIVALKPDVIALEEMGGTNAFFDLQRSLKTNGLDLPFWEYVTGFDTNIHVAVLSRFPIAARQPHTNDSYLLNGSRFQVSRGFAQVDIQVNPGYTFTLLAAHLKSKRPIGAADEADMRLEEAKILREKIDACLAAKPNINLIVLGDFNDLHNSQPLRTIVGRGKKALVDTRPAERNGDDLPHSDRRLTHRNVAWTHFYAVEDTYSRLDYILLNHGMAREWDPAETYVLALPNWGLASDHRPLVATFTAMER
ncbi:MAG: Endonuclease/exonuclease/phosphatase [Pedosphaera sp.]|nr:Endonuclease/exonuclease/phosphatase [Pedosphaera sp.]